MSSIPVCPDSGGSCLQQPPGGNGRIISVSWSFGLLPASERELFARLGVFAGSFGLPAAEAIGAGSPQEGQAGRPGQVMDTLSALVDGSLVRAQTGGGEPRFALLETIREYALDRLRGSGDWVQAHDRHAAYFLALAEFIHRRLHAQLVPADRLLSVASGRPAGVADRAFGVRPGSMQQASRDLVPQACGSGHPQGMGTGDHPVYVLCEAAHVSSRSLAAGHLLRPEGPELVLG